MTWKEDSDSVISRTGSKNIEDINLFIDVARVLVTRRLDVTQEKIRENKCGKGDCKRRRCIKDKIWKLKKLVSKRFKSSFEKRYLVNKEFYDRHRRV